MFDFTFMPFAHCVLVGSPTCEQAKGAACPLVHVHVVGVNVADQYAVIVIVQVVPTQYIELPPHCRHDVVYPPL